MCHLKACTLYAVGSDGSMAQSFSQDRGGGELDAAEPAGVDWPMGRGVEGTRGLRMRPPLPPWCLPLFSDVLVFGWVGGWEEEG